MPLKNIYNGSVPVWIQHMTSVLITVVSLTALGSVAWTQVTNQVDDNRVLSEKNGNVLDGVGSRLNALEKGQAVLQEQQRTTEVIQQEYREDTKSALDYIIRKIDRINSPPR